LTLYSNIFSKGSGIIHTEKQSIVISVYEFLKHQCKYFGIAIKNDFRVYQLSQKAETSTKEILSIIESNDNHVSLTQLEDCGDLVGYSKKELKAITPGDYVSAAYYKDIDEDVAQIILQEIIDGRQLQSDEWVNDNMINIYFNYILQPMAENGSKSIVLIQTYFFQRLYMDNKVPGTTQYSTIAEQALQYWKDGGSLYIIPINISNTHWTLVTVHMDQETMAYHDPLGMFNGINGLEYMESIFLFLREYQFKVDGNYDNAPDRESWTFHDATHFYLWDDKMLKCLNAPQQNSHDCGIFIIRFAELCVEFDTFNISEIIMENLPDRIVMRRAFLGLYAKYLEQKGSSVAGVVVASGAMGTVGNSSVTGVVDDCTTGTNGTVGKGNTKAASVGKRANEDGYGSSSDVLFKRVKTADRGRTDIILRTDLLPKPKPSPSKKLSEDMGHLKLSKKLTDEKEELYEDSSGKSCVHLEDGIIIVSLLKRS